MGERIRPDRRTYYARYPHGCYLRYALGDCRCEPCMEAGRARRRERAAGIRRRISLARVRQHLRYLRRHGVGKRAIAAVTGMDQRSITNLLRHAKTTTLATEAKILAVGLGARSDGAPMSAAQTHRRVRRLLAEGFTAAQITVQALGWTVGATSMSWLLRGSRCEARTAMLIEKFYRKHVAAPAVGAARVDHVTAPRRRVDPDRGLYSTKPRAKSAGMRPGKMHPWRLAERAGYLAHQARQAQRA